MVMLVVGAAQDFWNVYGWFLPKRENGPRPPTVPSCRFYFQYIPSTRVYSLFFILNLLFFSFFLILSLILLSIRLLYKYICAYTLHLHDFICITQNMDRPARPRDSRARCESGRRLEGKREEDSGKGRRQADIIR